MGRCRVYYRQDGKILVDHPDLRPEKKPKSKSEFIKRFSRYNGITIPLTDNITLDDWIDAQFIESAEKKATLHIDNDLTKILLPYDDIDSTALPNGANPNNRNDRNRWRGTKVTGVQIDNTVVLRKDLFQQIDDELAKPSPDGIVIERLRRKLEKREHND